MNMNEQMRKLREEIEETQKQELARLKESTSTASDDNLMGWLEALEYVKGQIDAVSNTGEPTVTVDDYHKKGDLYVTVRFPDGEEYSGLVEKQEGDEE